MSEPDEGIALTQAASAGTKPGPGVRFARRYLVERLLGRGGMGSVWAVLDVDLGEHVALKTLDQNDATTEMIERFRREVRLARRVTHRNVARIFDIGESSGVHYLTMEIVDGGSLGDRLRNGPLEVGQACAIALQIAQGLASAHAVEVIHRDLKPGNILLDPGGRAVLTDFGIACAITGDVRLTVEGAGFLGTPAYMSPEQVRGSAVDARSDIYAFGVILFEMLVGRLPFDGTTAISLAVARLHEPPHDPRQFADVGDGLATLVLECLALDPAERPPSAAELQTRLAGMDLAAPPSAAALDATMAAVMPPRSSTPRSSTATGAPPSILSATRSESQTVAVLPFRYRGVPGEEYLAEALSDELIDLLSRNRGLRVSARGATAKFSPDADPRAVGGELGVGVVIEGTVHRTADAIRIQVRLVAVETGFQLWSERFDGRLVDVFDLQDRIASQIAETLRVEIQTANQRNEVPAEAVALYMRARSVMRSFNQGGVGGEGSVALLEQALALAPTFRPAIAALAIATERMWFLPSTPSAASWRERAIVTVERALAEAPDFPETHLAAARIAMQHADYSAAAHSITRALVIAPTFAVAHAVKGSLQCEGGRAAEGLRHLRLAVTLDPTLVNAWTSEARYYAMHGEPERAQKLLDQAAAGGGPQIPVVATRMRLAGWRGDLLEFAGYRESPRRSELRIGIFDVMVQLYLRETSVAEGLARLRESMHPDIGPRFATLTLQLAIETCACLNEIATAEELLAEATDTGLVDLDWIDHCPPLEVLRTRPGFKALRERVHQRAEAIWSV